MPMIQLIRRHFFADIVSLAGKMLTPYVYAFTDLHVVDDYLKMMSGVICHLI